MSDPKAYFTMRELMHAIDARLTDLDAGRLRVDDLETMTGDARELYERLVVLRHHARLRRKQGSDEGSEIAAAEPPPMRLDTRPKELRQISLIDAIQEVEPVSQSHAEPAHPKGGPAQMQPSTPNPPQGQPSTSPQPSTRKQPSPPQPATVASRLEQAPIADLGKAIAISQKFWFINELFGRDAAAYEVAIKRINSSGGVEEARTFVHTEVVSRLKKAPEEEALTTFMELVERRFKA